MYRGGHQHPLGRACDFCAAWGWEAAQREQSPARVPAHGHGGNLVRGQRSGGVCCYQGSPYLWCKVCYQLASARDHGRRCTYGEGQQQDAFVEKWFAAVSIEPGWSTLVEEQGVAPLKVPLSNEPGFANAYKCNSALQIMKMACKAGN
eukprot:scaffold10602_cov19-Tisochrysis_lutea.AAC.2